MFLQLCLLKSYTTKEHHFNFFKILTYAQSSESKYIEYLMQTWNHRVIKFGKASKIIEYSH